MPRPRKYQQEMKVATLYIPEGLYQNLKETAKLKGCSVSELVVEILSNNLSPLEIIDKKIKELERQLEELYDLRQRTVAMMIRQIPKEHRNHIREVVERFFNLYRDNGFEERLENFLRKYSEVNNLPYEPLREFSKIVLEEFVERGRPDGE